MPAVVTAAVLRRARDLLSRGWVQGRISAPGASAARWCVVGAVYKAACEEARRRPSCAGQEAHMIDGAVASLRAVTGGEPLAAWNDHPDRTRGDVLEAVDKAMRQAAGDLAMAA